MRRVVGSLAVAALVCVVQTPAYARPGNSAQRSSANAVVALIDSGINPYHVTFRDSSPLAKKHPSTYIPGYPKDAEALRLTLDAPDLPAALKADCERVWQKVETGKLYWFPGTKIIGGITFQEKVGNPCALSGGGSIIDINGHGTMTASRATSFEFGACKECRVVSIQFSASALNTKDALDSITWAADNADWIDAQSNSWGPFAPLWEPTGSTLFTAGPQLVRAVEATAQKHLAFWASGNGAAFRGGGVGHPTVLSPHLTPSAIMVGGVDSGYVNTWPGFPGHVVSDSCNCWAAHNDSIDKSDEKVGSGTSSATPFAAGGAVYELFRARAILGETGTGVEDGVVARGPKGLVPSGPLADGEFTLEEWKRLVFVSATERPEAQYEDGPPCDAVDGTVLYMATPVRWMQVPEQYPEYLHIGYGAVDRPAMKLAVEIMMGKTEVPNRTDTDEFFAYDRQVRETTYGVLSRP
jgi:subtilisin family serine protease